MDGLTWLILSWLIVGTLCYLMLSKLGAPQTDVTAETYATTMNKSNTTSNTDWNTEKQLPVAKDWWNDIIAWLFSNMHRVPDTLQAWITAMNDAAKKVSSPGKCEVLFEGFGNHSNVKKAPRITNIRLQIAPNDHLIIRSDISIPEMNIKLVSSQRTDDRLLVTNYDAKITDLHGEIEARVACIANQLFLMVCFCGRPELDIQLVSRDSTPAGAVSSTMVDEVIRKCLLSAVTNVTLTEFSGQRGSATTVPGDVFQSVTRGMVMNERNANAPGSNISQVAAPVRMSQSAQLSTNQFANVQGIPNKVRVKVIRAQRLGGERSTKFIPISTLKTKIRCIRSRNTSITNEKTRCQICEHCASIVNSACSSWNALALLHRIACSKKKILQQPGYIPGVVNQPYVVLEMDEPPQKFQTSRGLNMSPYWEESFDFDLTAASEEILFEIYESENEIAETAGRAESEDDRFLGLAIVGLEELRRSSPDATAHTLKLQGRPYRNDAITGNLTVQFHFYHDPTVVSLGKHVDQTGIRNNVDQIRETVSSTRRPIYDPRDSFGLHDAHDVIPTKTTTVTVKNVSQQLSDDRTQPGSGVTVQQQKQLQPSATTLERPQNLLQQQHNLGDKVEHTKAYDLRGQQIGVSDTQRQQHHVHYGTSTKEQTFGGLPEQPVPQEYTSSSTNTATATVVGHQQQSAGVTNDRQQPVVPASSTDTAGDKRAAKTQQMTETNSHPPQRFEQQSEQEQTQSKINKTEITEITPAAETDESRQSRDREKKTNAEKSEGKRDRSFFSELRDRLSGRRRSKRRAKSCDIGTGELEEAVSLPPSRDPSRTRFSERTRSHESTSYGGKSERSTKSLYQHSTLLLEVHEKNGKVRYYLIPHTILDEPAAMKLLRQGKKLHVYNDHTFVAVKSRSGTICNVCHNRIGRSNFSKQAYQCRDCRLVCHKPCHYKTESYCTASNVNKLDITNDIDWAHFLTTYQVHEFISEDGV